MHHCSPLFPSFCRAASTVITLIPKATFTPSIQPNHGLPHTRTSLNSAINTILAIRYLSILSTCPNHLNTHRSALLANSLSIPAKIMTYEYDYINCCPTVTQVTWVKKFRWRDFSENECFFHSSISWTLLTGLPSQCIDRLRSWYYLLIMFLSYGYDDKCSVCA